MRVPPRNILYFGSSSPASTSRHRADALVRLGCAVSIIDLEELIGLHTWQAFFHYRTGYRLLQRRLLKKIQNSMGHIAHSPDLIWVNGGSLLGPDCLKWLRFKFACKIILYQNDDPTGSRDGNCFLSVQDGLPIYDLCALVRPESALEALAFGAQRVLRVFMSYDEVHHAPAHLILQQSPEPPKPVVSFIGTLIPGEARDLFLVALMHAGIPLRLSGNLWNRSPLWPLLRSFYQGPACVGTAYSRALGDAAVTLGLLSHQNRDLVTTRSFETTACGGLLCAERTSEHQLLYEQSDEAVFWGSLEECYSVCNNLLNNPELRQKICANGYNHVRSAGLGNEDVCRRILASI